MKIAEAMSRGVEPIAPSATVQDAAVQMAENDVGAVLVGSAEKVEGVLTDRDIILRLVVDGRNPAATSVRDVMSAGVFSCRADDSVEAAFAEMRERQIRRMPVLDEDGRLLGVVTLSDLARFIESPEQVEATLRDISEPHRSRQAPAQPPASPTERTADAGGP